jgi:hypothetical protein
MVIHPYSMQAYHSKHTRGHACAHGKPKILSRVWSDRRRDFELDIGFIDQLLT